MDPNTATQANWKLNECFSQEGLKVKTGDLSLKNYEGYGNRTLFYSAQEEKDCRLELRSAIKHNDKINLSGENEETHFDNGRQTLQRRNAVRNKKPPFGEQKLLCDNEESNKKLLFLINKNGGEGKGKKIFDKLKKLNDNRIKFFDIKDFSKKEVDKNEVEQFVDNDTRFVFCGGDGTITWGFQIMENWDLKDNPVAFMPLGTANEIAKCTGWKNNFNVKDLQKFIDNARKNDVVEFDTWNVEYKDKEDHEYSGRRPTIMAAFLSFGFDAKIASDFDKKRNKKLQKNKTPTILESKGNYFVSGAKAMLNTCPNFGDEVSISVDGNEVDIQKFKCVQILNIPSMSDGCDFWGKKEKKRDRIRGTDGSPQSLNDGKLEIVGHESITKYITSFVKARMGTRLAQGKEIKIEFGHPTYIEVDGEPFKNPAGTVSVTFNRKCNIVKGPNTNWATGRVIESILYY